MFCYDTSGLAEPN